MIVGAADLRNRTAWHRFSGLAAALDSGRAGGSQFQVSRDEGCEGRIGLHALTQSEGFYRSCRMTDLGIDEDHEDRLRYCEMTKKAADRFLEGT